MGLTSSLSTALTGMNAAEAQIDVLGNNLANSQTVGFKASEIAFASQFLQTLSLGSAPTVDNGGTNPRQAGLGVQVAAINQSFRQGTIEISSNSSDLAIQGDGFFQVEAAQGERLYTRNGMFRLNSFNELVTITGNRVLGYGVDAKFNLQPSVLTPLTIPLGTEAVAKATSQVTLQGTLTPQGDIADTAEILQSATLGNGAIPYPSATGITLGAADRPAAAAVTVTQADSGGNHPEGAVYQYRLVYVDTSGKESMASDPISVTVPAGDTVANNRITLNTLPSGGTQYSSMKVYRTAAGGSDFFLHGTATPGGSYVDSTTTLSATPLQNAGLTGNYTYMVTYYKVGSPESRPSPLMGPQNVSNGRIHLGNLPVPPPPASDGIAYDQIRIYRNLGNNSESFYLVDTVAPGSSYTDSKSDAAISNLTLSGNKTIDLDGPLVDSNTLLTDVTRRDGYDYSKPFAEGTLTFRGRKGGRALEEKSFQITSTSTVQDLKEFMEASFGIIDSSGDGNNPIPPSKNNIAGEGGTIQPGSYINNGRIRMVSNAGEINTIQIDLSSLRLTDNLGNVTNPNLAFSSIQTAKGQGTSADFIAYDSLGLSVQVRLAATLESRTDSRTVYRWYGYSPDNLDRGTANTAVGTGLIYFDGAGNFVSSSNDQIAIRRDDLPSTKPMEFTLDFSNLSGLAAEKATMAASRQDGSPPGVLNSYVIGEDGTVRGVFSNGVVRDLGQVRLARFTNPNGLEQRGQNLYAQGINSGLSIQGSPGEDGIGMISSGALELSNTDVGGDLVSLVLASTQYRSNARVITATQQLFDELLNLRR
jgi:flagellar hook protein FlgE